MNNLRDKPLFIVTLLAALLAFCIFKNELSQKTIFLGIAHTNLLQLILIFAILLSLSAYLYALDFVRYGTSFENNIILRRFILVGHFFYILAVFFPIIIGLVWLIVWLLNIILANVIVNQIVTVVVLSLSFFISSYFADKMKRSQRNQLAEKIQEKTEENMERAFELYTQKFYPSFILESYNTALSLIRTTLESKGYSTINLPATTLLLLAKKEKVISPSAQEKLNKLKILRNKAAHMNITLSKADADFAKEIVKSISKQLDFHQLLEKETEEDQQKFNKQIKTIQNYIKKIRNK